MRNHFEGAMPEDLAKALLKPKDKPARSSERVVRPVPATAVLATK